MPCSWGSGRWKWESTGFHNTEIKGSTNKDMNLRHQIRGLAGVETDLSILPRNSDEMGMEEGAVTRGGCGTQGGLFLQEKGSCSLLMFLQEQRETVMIQEREGEARP